MNKEINIEQNKEETVSTMETVLFTNLTEKKIKSESLLSNCDLLDFIAFENKIKARFTPSFIKGESKEIEKANDKLINLAKYN